MLAEALSAPIGQALLLLGMAASLFGALSLTTSIRTKNPRLARNTGTYAVMALVGAVGAAVVMERALINRDFSLKFTQQVGSPNTPALFNFAAMWSALEGSILLWLMILAIYLFIVVRRYRKRLNDPLIAWAVVVMFVVATFFFLLAAGPANAFARGGPPNMAMCCRGPNPLLQNHVLVMFHPPLLYLGYVGVTVPFAFAMAALITGRVGEGWLAETRRWALFAWGFLTVGILLGGWWSYEVLGWGGVWGWDPVENASLLPWLTGTAYLHSVMVQERRGMLRVWNISLLVATFALTILGTFLTRSGVVNSVHAFSDGSIGAYLLGFFGLIVVVALALIAWRGDRLRAPGAIDSPLSREGAFLANNVVFALFAFVVLLGTVFPLIVEALQDRKLAVAAPFFDTMSVPIGLVLLFLMAIAPVLPWRKASAELLSKRLFWPAWVGAGALVLAVAVGADGFAPLVAFFLGGFAAGSALRQVVLATRRQGFAGMLGRANGGMIVHLGVIILAVALVSANAFTRSADLSLSVGQPAAAFEGHTFALRSIDAFSDARSKGVKAHVIIDGGQAYAPALTTYTGMGRTIGTPSVKTGVGGDIYLTLVGSPVAGGSTAQIKVFLKPLTVWLWIGGGLMALGTVLAAFPGRRRRRPTDPVSADAVRIDPPSADESEVVGVGS